MRTRFIGDFALCRQWYGYALNRYRALGDSQSCILRPDIGVEIVLRKENDLVGEIRIKAQVKADYYSTQHLFIDVKGDTRISIPDMGGTWRVLICDLVVVLVDDKSEDGNVYEIRLPLVTPSYRVADEILAATFDLANPKNVYFVARNKKVHYNLSTYPLDDTHNFTVVTYRKDTDTYKLYKTTIEKDEEGALYLTEPQLVKEFPFVYDTDTQEVAQIPLLDEYEEFWLWGTLIYTTQSDYYKIYIRDLYVNGNVFKWLYEWFHSRERGHLREIVEDNYHITTLREYNGDILWPYAITEGTEKIEWGWGYEEVGNFSYPYTVFSASGTHIDFCEDFAWDGTLTDTRIYSTPLNVYSLDKEVSPICVLNEDDFLVAEAANPYNIIVGNIYATDFAGEVWTQRNPQHPFRFRVYTNDDQYQQIVGHSPPILYEIDSGYTWEDFKRIFNWALCLYEHDYCVMIDYIVKSSEADLDFLYTLFVGYLQDKKAYLAAKKKAEETGDETKKKDAILRGVLVGNKSIFFVNATKQTTQAKDIQNDPIYHITSGDTYRRVRMDVDEGTKDVSQIYPRPYIANILLVDKRNNIRRCNGKPPSIGGNNNGT